MAKSSAVSERPKKRRPYRAIWRNGDGRIIVRRYSDRSRRDHVVALALISGVEVLRTVPKHPRPVRPA